MGDKDGALLFSRDGSNFHRGSGSRRLRPLVQLYQGPFDDHMSPVLLSEMEGHISAENLAFSLRRTLKSEDVSTLLGSNRTTTPIFEALL